MMDKKTTYRSYPFQQRLRWPLTFACLLLTLSAAAAPHRFDNGLRVTEERVPGGIALVDLGPERLPEPSVNWSGQPIAVLLSAGRWIALVGIPLQTKPGEYALSVFSTVARKSKFRVSPKQYPLQKLTIADTTRVTPPPELQTKLADEANRMRNARRRRSEGFSASDFAAPLTGRFTSPFGLRRLYNNRRRGRHTGLDIASPTGTPVQAAFSGRVIERGEFHFNGNTVFIDHGQGMVSLYSHLNDMVVKPGEEVETGQIIGHVGATGRVTGPHLHWGMALNGSWINPALFMPPEK